MGRIPGHYEWDDDDLTPGRKKEGGLHQNLFDSEGNLKGSARFIPGHDDEPLVVTETIYVPVEQRRRTREQEELDQAIADLTTVLVLVGIDKLKPHAEKLWREKARPVIDAQRAKLPERFRRKAAKPAPAIAGTVVGPASDLMVGPQGDGPNMSRAEAQARYLAGMAARAYSDEQFRLVSCANIIDTEGLEALKRSLAELPADEIKALLEVMATNPSMLGEDTLAQLASLLARRERLELDHVRRLD